MQRLLLDALTVSQNELFVDELLDVFKLGVWVGIVARCAILNVEGDLLGTVDAHRETAGGKWVQIFIVAEHLEDPGRLRDAFLLDPHAEPVHEASQAELVLSVLSKLVNDMVPEKV